MKKPIIVFLFLLFVQIAFTQEVVSSAGATQEASGYEVSWTLGEPVIETFSLASNILTQGFHQTKLVITAIGEPEIMASELKVYPNPTSDFFIIHFSSDLKDKHYSLFDMTGKMLELNSILETDTKINVSNLASGTYLLHIGANKTNLIQSFKIVKK